MGFRLFYNYFNGFHRCWNRWFFTLSHCAHSFILCWFGVNGATELVVLKTVTCYDLLDLLTLKQIVDNVTVLYMSVDTQYEWENYSN